MAVASSKQSTRSGRTEARLRSGRARTEAVKSNPTVEELRDARAAYYNTPANERVKRDVPRPQKSHASSDRLRVSGAVKAGRTTRPKPKSSISGAQSKRRQHKSQKDEGRGDYVYEHRRGRDASGPGGSLQHGGMAVELESSNGTHPRSTLLRSASTPQAKHTTARPALSRRDTVSSAAPSKKDGHRNSLLASIFRSQPPTKPRVVECLTCGADDISIARTAKLSCGHRMCNSCLKRIFTLSVTDPAHMPPKCCTSQHIPLKHVDHIFDLKFKMRWNKKYQEYTTKNRLYCPTKGCGEWIKPSNIHTDQGRKYGRCGKCKTKVCALCNCKFHTRRECPKDDEMNTFIETAKEKGWQRCYSCKAMIELKEGCNHMTCRCTAEFCMLCGSQWKTCDCPWFNYTQVPDGDRLQQMRVPELIPIIRRRLFDDPAPVPPTAAPDPRARNNPNPALTYQQELDARRRQERLDEALARRLQIGGEPAGAQRPRHEDANEEVFGNAGGHFLNDDFVQEATNVVMGVLQDAGFGRRGERVSGRRRRARQDPNDNGGWDAGLAPNAFGDASVLGIGPAQPAPLRRSGTLTEGLKRAGRESGGDRIGQWLQRVGG
ncbi:hypothetical protein MBLNU459_g7887t1 [Dothideomycetes sp. NU459]